jgi:outer membrane lipoprotein-sorting protein
MLKYTTLALALAAVPFASHAETPQEKGLEIAKKQDAANTGFQDYETDMVMILKTADGKEITRNLKAYALEVATDGDKSMMIFDQPADVKGTAILTWAHGVNADDQWLFLPAVKRVKRLNSQNKSGPFMGSEFAYEDLSSPVPERYKHTWLREEPCGKLTCSVIERVPAYEYSGYSKLVVWVDTEALRTQKIDYYDRKNEKLKTLVNADFKLFKNKYWRAEKGTMSNVQTGKSTVLLSKKTEFGVGLKAAQFESDSLERAR